MSHCKWFIFYDSKTLRVTSITPWHKAMTRYLQDSFSLRRACLLLSFWSLSVLAASSASLISLLPQGSGGVGESPAAASPLMSADSPVSLHPLFSAGKSSWVPLLGAEGSGAFSESFLAFALLKQQPQLVIPSIETPKICNSLQFVRYGCVEES